VKALTNEYITLSTMSNGYEDEMPYVI